MATKGVQEGRARAGSAWRKLEEGHALEKVGSSMNRPHKGIRTRIPSLVLEAVPRLHVAGPMRMRKSSWEATAHSHDAWGSLFNVIKVSRYELIPVWPEVKGRMAAETRGSAFQRRGR
ncbi:hypothetical protein DNFV4_02246 [Nitrospira tepida]|uniref:Uncharacterized protein n=1 Tax=Nitrospira tepida TaxID=2973512 RepID=A0AA86MZA4_9BACT|nr:hypothetical protein DNFV4_02246 [Nitrospira tepida]